MGFDNAQTKKNHPIKLKERFLIPKTNVVLLCDNIANQI